MTAGFAWRASQRVGYAAAQRARVARDYSIPLLLETTYGYCAD
jgi:hypothetical protein